MGVASASVRQLLQSAVETHVYTGNYLTIYVCIFVDMHTRLYEKTHALMYDVHACLGKYISICVYM